MLTYKTITTQAAYFDKAWTMLRQIEGTKYSVYADSRGYASMGVGFNLTKDNVRTAVYGGLGFKKNYDDATISALEQDYIRQLNDVFTSGSTQLQADLDAIMTARSHDTRYTVTDITRRSAFTFSPADTGLTEMRGVFDSIRGFYETEINNHISGVPLSDERVALFSLAYNNPALLGAGLRNAISTGNRAEAWYEIRYKSNGGHSRSPGIANRRYTEAQMFGLYNDAPSENDHLSAYRMFTHNRAYIMDYERTFSPATGQTAKAKLAPAYTYLINTYAAGTGISIDWHDVSVAYEGGDILTGVTRSGNTYGTGEDVNNLIIGSDNFDVLEGAGGRDVLVGNGGVDFIMGGVGDDILNGGIGSDLYIYRVGDGNDIISDSDKQGYIRYDRGGAKTVLSGGKSDTTSGGIYYSADRSIRYQWDGVNGSQLTISMQGNAGSITVDDFYNDNLGIRLATKPCASNCPPPGGPGGSGGSAGAGGTARTIRYDPLALDLDGDRIETVALTDSTVYFDFNGDGNAVNTGWLAPDDGWLVWDRNGNGNIDSGRELFGEDTLKRDGSRALDGFDALADEDINGDGIIDVSDSVFSNLKIWRDLNQDGVSQVNELISGERKILVG